MQFQSTPPVKAATKDLYRIYKSVIFQSTPPVKAATVMTAHTADDGLFQSTPPVKAATSISIRTFRHAGISIHAAREGGDDKSKV